MTKENIKKRVSDGNVEIELCCGFPLRKMYYYLIKKGEDYIGNCGLRLEDNDENYYLGNVEYEIFEPYRGNGYAEEATRLLARVASELGATELNITARPDNNASIRTIERLGARFVEVANVPKKYRLYKDSPVVSVYNWQLEGEKKK